MTSVNVCAADSPLICTIQTDSWHERVLLVVLAVEQPTDEAPDPGHHEKPSK